MPESKSKPAQQEQREFIIQRIYTKDISFESPNAPRVFQQEWKPESNLNLNTQVDKLADDLFEVVLTVTVTTKLGGQTAYLAEVKQGGVFLVRGFSDQEMGPMMGAFCPNILFPYAREVITDLVSKGSFPQMVLQPVNFEAMYAQHQQEQAQRAAQSATEPTAH